MQSRRTLYMSIHNTARDIHSRHRAGVLALCIVLALVVSECLLPPLSRADEGSLYTARVAYIISEQEIEVAGQPVLNQSIELLISSGERRGDPVRVEHRVYTRAGGIPLGLGDQVYIRESEAPDGSPSYTVTGFARAVPLMALTVAFVVIVLAVAQGRGLRALLGMALSFAIITVLLMPRFGGSTDPLKAALFGAALALPVLYIVAHGVQLKTVAALVGSYIGLGLAAGLAVLAARLTRLSGYASEEIAFLQSVRGGSVDALGIMLAGILISVVGVLDDITIAQAGVVDQLGDLDRDLSWQELYRRAMHVGRDHIASMVNTLVLVYAGASLPLLMLVGNQSLDLAYFVSQNIVAEEIVRVLVSSMALVSVVPITTLVAALTRKGVDRLKQPN